MCTIGAIIDEKTILFKSCDLNKKTHFYNPEIRQGKYKYIAFIREGRPGIWAGINEKGLGIVAADAYTKNVYTKKKYKAKPHLINNVFKTYEKLVADFPDSEKGEKFLKNFYLTKIKVIPDLVILADKQSTIVIEFTPPNKWITKRVKKGFLVRSNHFILSPGIQKREDILSSYARYETAYNFLSKTKISIENIKKLCRNHQNGPGINSICRHGKKNERRTQASVIMSADKKISAYYAINNFPCRGNYKKITICEK